MSGQKQEIAHRENCQRVLDQAEAYGIDLSLLAANRRLTPRERIRQHQRNLNLVQSLPAAMEKARG